MVIMIILLNWQNAYKQFVETMIFCDIEDEKDNKYQRIKGFITLIVINMV